jgi:hypothetical protein
MIILRKKLQENKLVNELETGIQVELEHRPTYEWFKDLSSRGISFSLEEFAEHIAMDHLAENSQYYQQLLKNVST